MQRNPPEARTPLFDANGILGFRPWMLALAVFLACAIGIGLMERFRDADSMWAQAAAESSPGR